jgi:hypothetical protein
LVADLGYLPLAIRPTANGGIRAVVRKGTRIYIFDANGGAVAERGRWTLRDGETWVSTGRGGETLVSFRRADGRGGVFIYGAAGVAGYLLDNVAGPAALDLAGGLTVLTDVRDDASPPVVASPPVGDRVTETALLTVMAQ